MVLKISVLNVISKRSHLLCNIKHVMTKLLYANGKNMVVFSRQYAKGIWTLRLFLHARNVFASFLTKEPFAAVIWDIVSTLIDKL